jgi:uncharacterized protein
MVTTGRRRELYHFRDRQGLEVDFIVPRRDRSLCMIEAKATQTPSPSMAKSLRRLMDSAQAQDTCGLLVHRPIRSSMDMHGITPGIRALAWNELGTVLSP